MFGVRYNGSPNQYGGMYVETSNAGGWPFYGYATNGSFRAWTYYNGTTGEWSLYSAGVRLKVPSTGGLRIGPSQNYSLVISNTTGSGCGRSLPAKKQKERWLCTAPTDRHSPASTSL